MSYDLYVDDRNVGQIASHNGWHDTSRYLEEHGGSAAKYLALHGESLQPHMLKANLQDLIPSAPPDIRSVLRDIQSHLDHAQHVGISSEDQDSDDVELTELTRPPLPHERKHDFQGHAERQDKTQNAVRRILASSKMALIADAARRASSLNPETLGTLQLPYARQLAARIAGSSKIAHQYGYDQVYAERYRATKRPKTTAVVRLSTIDDDAQAAADSAEQDTPELIAKAAVADLQNWITSRSKGAHVDAYTKGLRDQVLQQAIEDNLTAGSDAMLDRIAAEAARSSVAGGRYTALLELQSEIAKYARSEAMDRNTCGPCQVGDGQEWKSLAEVTWSPGDDCEGGDACRGQLLPIFADEGTVQTG